eukprot:6023103-Pyramimonas_sp.AAC.1
MVRPKPQFAPQIVIDAPREPRRNFYEPVDSRRNYPRCTKYYPVVDNTGHGAWLSEHDAPQVDFDKNVRREIYDTRRDYPVATKYDAVVDETGHGSRISVYDAPQVDFRSCLPYSAIAHHQYIGSKKLDRVDYGNMGRNAPGSIYNTEKVRWLFMLIWLPRAQSFAPYGSSKVCNRRIYEQNIAAKRFNSSGAPEARMIKWTMRYVNRNNKP